jgi:hypothetical protein
VSPLDIHAMPVAEVLDLAGLAGHVAPERWGEVRALLAGGDRG